MPIEENLFEMSQLQLTRLAKKIRNSWLQSIKR